MTIRTARVIFQCHKCREWKEPGEKYEDVPVEGSSAEGVKFVARHGGRGEPGQYRAIRQTWNYQQRVKICAKCANIGQ